MPETHRGSCHCGRVTFEVDAEIRAAVECSCSICRRKGALYHAAALDDLRILSGEADLVLYQFNTGTARHYFCRHCGIHPFHRPRLDPGRWAVNVRCLEGVDLAALERRHFDGADFETAAAAVSKDPTPDS